MGTTGSTPATPSLRARIVSRLKAVLDHKIVSGVVVAVLTAVVLAALGLGGGGGGKPTPTDPPGPPVLADFDLQVEVDPDQVAGPGEPFFYWLPDDVRSLDDPPDDCRDRREWAYGAGGADADVVWAQLTVENNRDRQVRIDDVRVVETDEAISGGTVAACPVGGASSSPHGLVVDLSQQPPVVQFSENEGEQLGSVPGFVLEPGEQEAFTIHVTGRADRVVSWRLVADVRSGGKTMELTVPPEDEAPMRIAGTAGLPMFIWTDGSWDAFQP